ncbi:MAG TPA: MBL fold metallo-hydrolase [Rudaea sp.]|nr:MBL fold metallo-hydrolase [Rudaea sp.]
MLGLIAFAALAAADAGIATPPQKSWGPYTYDTVKVGDGVYAFIETMHSIVSGNVIAVIGTRSILVFDTGQHPPMAHAIAEDIKRLSDKPVRYIAVSHWHDDHWVGNADFAAVYPDVQVLAHPFTAAQIAERRATFAGAPCKALLEKQVKPMRDELASGKKADGSPVSDERRKALAVEAAGFDEQEKECDQMRFRGVDLTFESKLAIDLGGRTVELMHLGRGNTAGDIVAWLPESKTLLTGDLLVHPFPFATQSYITEWAAVMHKLDALDATTIVPGHGPVMHDKRYLEDVAALLDALSAQAHAAYRPGMTADELRSKVDFSAFSDRFSHGERFIKINFDYMIGQPAIDRLWQELSGQWKPEGE